MPRTVFLDTKLEFGLLGIKRHDLKDKIFLCVLKSGCIESHCLLVLVFPQEFPQQHSGCSVGERSSAFWGSHGMTSEEDYSYTYELLISPPGNSEIPGDAYNFLNSSCFKNVFQDISWNTFRE